MSQVKQATFENSTVKFIKNVFFLKKFVRFPVAQAGHYSLSGLDILIFFVFVFQDRASLCGFGSARTHSVDQSGLELRDPLPPKCWD